MKLKYRPEDFQVEELSDHTPNGGEFALYRLDKTGWTTPDAIQAIRRRWQIDARRVGYGGLKDRHAMTSQYLTIFRGPQRGQTHRGITLTYLGQRSEPYTSSDIRANRFAITLRSLSDPEVDTARVALAEVATTGLPNYFDDQRFGSVGESREFVARELVFGRFERALWLALAAPYEHDRADAKREKEVLNTHWGRWAECKAALPKGHARSLVSYLCDHPTDFKGAVARLRPELQGLYLAAYQSSLWNRMLALWLTRSLPVDQLGHVELKLGVVPVPRTIPQHLRNPWESLTLPLPSARLKPDPSATWKTLVDDVLSTEGLTLQELKVKGLNKPFFSKGDRAGCVHAANLVHTSEADELHRGRRKLILSFELPRGSYATILVKRVTAVDAMTRPVG